MIWHGEWADPELEYNGKVADYYDVENAMVDQAKEDGVNTDDDDAFGQYVREHSDDAKFFLENAAKTEEVDDEPIESYDLTGEEDL